MWCLYIVELNFFRKRINHFVEEKKDALVGEGIFTVISFYLEYLFCF